MRICYGKGCCFSGELHKLARAVARRRRVYHANGHISFRFGVDERYPKRSIFVIAHPDSKPDYRRAP